MSGNLLLSRIALLGQCLCSSPRPAGSSPPVPHWPTQQTGGVVFSTNCLVRLYDCDCLCYTRLTLVWAKLPVVVVMVVVAAVALAKPTVEGAG